MTDPEDLWAGLQLSDSADRYRGRPAPNLADGVDARLALDHHGLRHLLIRVPDGGGDIRHRQVRGLNVTVEPLEGDDGTPLDHVILSCTEAAAGGLFARVVADILDELRARPDDPRTATEDVLARWNWFWGVPSQGLSEEQIIGLFAELWFMERWIGPVDIARLRSWTGPEKDRHDFQTRSASVEVKATGSASAGAAEHRISSLDQLDDPQQGELYLFSLRVTSDRLASHSLAAIVDRIGAALHNDLSAIALWNERLARSGYSPLHIDRYRQRLRIVAQELYRVGPGFPRLTRATFTEGLPAGVSGVSYVINLAAATSHRIATGPHEGPANTWKGRLA